MVDIGEKEVVRRKAVASGKIMLGKRSLDAIRSGTVRKGDVLEAAKIAAIQAVKSTPDSDRVRPGAFQDCRGFAHLRGRGERPL
jgi:molybdenum cofactor biosynthesis enzyme